MPDSDSMTAGLDAPFKSDLLVTQQEGAIPAVEARLVAPE
jgi:hypothetical protein